ncbi:MAG: DUF6544 family protein [Pseudomonadota bacterium]
MWLLWPIGGVTLAVIALALRRRADRRADTREAARLRAASPRRPAAFALSMVSDLPEPAQRYFRFSIAPGTVLHTVAELHMQGRFSLGQKDDPKYMEMTARQILAPLEGFVWAADMRMGAIPLSGSDSGGWTRFWLAGVVPVARQGGNPDHARSAFGRQVAEAAFWCPAALLPSPVVTWAAVDETTARVTLRRGDLEQAVDITVDVDGRPTRVVLQRWSDANPARVFRLQPFGGDLSEFREVQGFRLATHVEAGNLYGTRDYFPFFIVDVVSVRFGAEREPGGETHPPP